MASAATELTYEENGTDPVATLSATDEDGDAIEWTLDGDDKGKFKISDDGVLEFKDSPNYESAGDKNENNVYLVKVKASEASELELEITVTDVDEDGKVTFDDLGQRQPQVGRSLEAELSDPDADVEDERWQWARGETATGPWTDIDRATSASRSPVADDLDMYLRATVTYDDKFGADKTESAVTENAVEDRTRANAAPSFEGQDETGPTVDDNDETDGTQDNIIVNRDVDEGVKGANVGKPVTATDPDNDVLVYSIESVGYDTDLSDSTEPVAEASGKFSFSIDSRSGQLKTTKKLVSDNSGTTGATADTTGEHTYTVTVKATDPSGASEMQPVTVTVNDVNDAPKITAVTTGDGGQNRTALTVVENVDGTGGGVDLDANTETLVQAPTFLATDADDGDVNANDDTAAAETTPALVRLKYSIEGADEGAFRLSSTTSPDDTAGVTLFFKDDHKVNYETKDEYEITIVASDDSAPEGVGKLDVTVKVVNAEDMGVVTPTQREPQVGKDVVASLTDEDGDLRSQSWQWYRLGEDTDTEAEAADVADGTLDDVTTDCPDGAPGDALCTIKGATSPDYRPGRFDNERYLAARVTYNDACVRVENATLPVCATGTDAGDSMFLVTQAAVEIEAADNTAPKFRDDQDANTPGDQADADRSVPENVKGANVGDPVTANDGDKLIYSLSGADASSFTIVSGLKGRGEGEGQIKTAVKLDYETKDMYMVVVTATDPSGATDTINVNIEVTDADDKTVVTIVNMMDEEIDYDEGGTDPVATLSAADQDDDEIDWSLSNDDASKFKISDDGVLEFKDSPNYEGPADKNENNVYLVSVTASETSNTLDLEVTVLDVDEAGKVTFDDLGQRQPQVGRSLEAELSDPDADVEDERWQWARGESAAGPWTDIDKATSASRSPVADDLDMYLRATVTYDDKFGTDKTESAVTENAVEDRTRANAAPSFEGQDETGPAVDDDTNTDGDQDKIIVNRDVDEGVKGANVGKPVTATDANNDVLVYSIESVGYDTVLSDATDPVAEASGKFSFSIDSKSGQLKTTKKLVSDNSGTTGATADTTGEHTYTVTVKATDPSGASKPQPVTVTVNDVNDAPKITAVTTGTEGQNRTALTVVENVDGTGGGVGLDANTETDVQAPTFLATDADDGDVNAAADAAATETTPALVRLKYSIEGVDKGAFQLSRTTSPDAATGVTLSFKSDHKVNYETKDEYEITIVATDDSAPEGVGKLDVTVNVMNAEDMGVVTPTQREPQVGKDVVASLTDEDGDLRNQSWQWYRLSAETDTVADDTLDDVTTDCPDGAPGDALCTIKGATSPDYRPGRFDNERYLAARVTYNDACVRVENATLPVCATGTDAGDSMFLVTQAAVEIEAADNTAPKFRDDQDANTPGDQADADRSVPENVKGANVGDPVTANDGDKLIYSLSGADASSFTIVSGLKGRGEGEGQIKTAVKLDYETKDMYMVVVTATDPSGATDTINVNIEVTDADDKTVVILGAVENTPPAFSSATATRNVDENMYAGAAVGDPVTATDEDAGDSLTYSLSETGYFEIDGDGQITTTMMLDYEAMSTHMVTVTATDEEGATDSVDVTINVENAHTGCDTAGNMGLVNDCEALLDSEDALGGSLNWADDTPMDDWDGITTNGDPMRVTAVNLRDMGLDGTIPGALGRLSALTSLNLRSNADLSGEIPGALNYLTNLTVLNLHSNSHTGEIPDLSGTALQGLYLSNNDLTGGVPAWLNMMSDITDLWLTGNDLAGAMPNLSGMTSLEKLKVNGNSVSGLDAAMLPGSLRWLVAGETDTGATAPDLNSLMNLTTLWLNKNGLTGQIPVASIPTSVTALNLRDNSLSGTIPDMSGLDNLRYLYLNSNSLSGDIPGTMGDMDSIERIWLHMNDLTGIGAGLSNAADTLTHLFLAGNDFAEGTCLPGDIAGVTNNDFDTAGPDGGQLAACPQ